MVMKILDGLDAFLYYPVLIIVLLAAGLYFSFRTKFVQLRLFPESVRVVMEKPNTKGSISSFQALMVSTASRVGTGNIVGVSTAVCCGGYGAVFWMWLIALIGGASAFIESTLAQIYKRKDSSGGYYGGPAYYIESALHNRGLAVVFAVSLILTYAFGFNMLASYNLQSTFSVYEFYNPAVTPWIIGAILAVLVGWCIMGGGQPVGAGERTRAARAKGLYDTDVEMQIKKSNENPMVLSLYDGMLKGKTHQLLHRNFEERD